MVTTLLVFLAGCFFPSMAKPLGCNFDDNMLVQQVDEGIGTRSFQHRSLNTKWDDHDNEIPYYFDVKFPEKDKAFFRKQMKEVEQNTCLSFKEIIGSKPEHRLKIQVDQRHKQCSGGSVTISSWSREVVFRTTGRCNYSPGHAGLILHELGHVLGLAHTQKRPDRDQYLNIDETCIEDGMESQYEKLREGDVNYFGIPYMCNSIMHYNNYDYSCPVMKAKPTLRNCKNGKIGGFDKPLPEDWELIRRAHCPGNGNGDGNGGGNGDNNNNNCRYQNNYHDCDFLEQQGLCFQEGWEEFMDEYCSKSCKC